MPALPPRDVVRLRHLQRRAFSAPDGGMHRVGIGAPLRACARRGVPGVNDSRATTVRRRAVLGGNRRPRANLVWKEVRTTSSCHSARPRSTRVRAVHPDLRRRNLDGFRRLKRVRQPLSAPLDRDRADDPAEPGVVGLGCTGSARPAVPAASSPAAAVPADWEPPPAAGCGASGAIWSAVTWSGQP